MTNGETVAPMPLGLRARVLLVAAVVLSAAIGILPYALYLERWWVVGAAAGMALLVSLMTAAEHRTESRSQPTSGEVLLGTWASVGFAAILAGVCLLVEGVLALLWRGAGWAVAKLGGTLPGAPDTVGLWASLVVFFLLGVGTSVASAQEFAAQLYPKRHGESSHYGRLLGRTRPLSWSALASLVLLVLILVLTDLGSGWNAAWLTLWLVGSTVPLTGSTSDTGDHGRAKQRIVEIVQAAGYHAQIDPSSGKLETDALLKDLDLLAVGPREAFAIEVKANRRTKPVEWYEASHLRTAAWALEQWLAEDGRPRSVEPLLVLVDSQEAESLKHFLGDEPLAMARTTFAALKQLDGADAESLRGAASEILGLPPAERTAPETQKAGT